VSLPTEGPAVALLDADPDLADAVPVEAHALARCAVTAATLDVQAGSLEFDVSDSASPRLGLLVLNGVLLREVLAGGGVAAELLGPGDVIVPMPDWGGGDFVISTVSWAALVPGRLAILDAPLFARLSEWPSVWAMLLRRLAERSARQAAVQAICHHPRVDARLRGLLWHLATRWGRVTPAGVVLPLRLTHDALASLVGAQRPTVSTALKGLADAGEVTRRHDGAWVLRAESQDQLKQLRHRNAARIQPALKLVGDGTDQSATLAGRADRLQLALEQQSASVTALRQRIAALQAETQEVARARHAESDGRTDGKTAS